MWYIPYMAWRVLVLNETVELELNALADDLKARFVSIAKLIQDMGLPAVGAPHVKHIKDALWEIRLSGRDGIARALYVTASGERVVVVRVFLKKTQKTPKAEIDLALTRAKGLKKK
jgi:phage-related protein